MGCVAKKMGKTTFTLSHFLLFVKKLTKKCQIMILFNFVRMEESTILEEKIVLRICASLT
jgi:hypothetical protein